MDRDEIAPDLVTYNSLIKAHGTSMEWAKALAVLKEMRRNQKVPDPNVVTYGAAISACARCNQWVEALELCNEWRAGGNKPDQKMLQSMRTAYNHRFLDSTRQRRTRTLSDIQQNFQDCDRSVTVSSC
uniref:Pentacotripeptide-repeat region of PRORP domain-containing protein n=1 Tax=Noctiluca scintillans TaxID=2966 RepID=A0A7S1FA29_NOCSC